MSNKKEMVGMDRKFCPVYVGDTIIDASGVKYTISERGTCVNAAGKDYAFSDLHGPELCSEEQEPVALAEPTPEVKLLPKRKGGKENKSGLVSLGSLARRLRVKQAGIARTLRAGGIDVVKGNNCYGIRVADIEKAEQLLAPLSAVIKPHVVKKVAEVKREVQKRTKLTDASGAILPGVTISHEAIGDQFEERVVIGGDRLPAGASSDRGSVVDFEELCERAKTLSELERLCREQLKKQEKLLGRAQRNLEVTVLPMLTSATDQQLAEELRRRGYEVIATKTVVVSL